MLDAFYIIEKIDNFLLQYDSCHNRIESDSFLTKGIRNRDVNSVNLFRRGEFNSKFRI